MKKIIIIVLALMFVATPVFARPHHPTPTPTPSATPEPSPEPTPPVGPVVLPQPSTTQYFGANGQLIRTEVVDRDGVVLSSWSMPTPTPVVPAGVPVEPKSWLEQMQEVLNQIEAALNEILKNLK